VIKSIDKQVQQDMGYLLKEREIHVEHIAFTSAHLMKLSENNLKLKKNEAEHLKQQKKSADACEEYRL